MAAEGDNAPLDYTVYACSSSMDGFRADSIMSTITDTTNRWTANAQLTDTHEQWILLELLQTSVVKSILFGKPPHSHPSNVDKFEVYIGMTQQQCSINVLRGCLRNDGSWETFELRCKDEEGTPTPARFVKIIPVSTHEANFRPSIWHVSLQGSREVSLVSAGIDSQDARREETSVRLVAKFLNARGLLALSNDVLAHAGLILEHSSVSTLRCAILSGDWSEAETALSSCATNHLFSHATQTNPLYITWSTLIPGEDFATRRLEWYRYLRDFWMYDISKNSWSMITRNIAWDGGPNHLHFHRLLWDANEEALYLVTPILDEESIKCCTPDGFTMHHTWPAEPIHVSAFVVYRWDSSKEHEWTLLGKTSPVSDSEGYTERMVGENGSTLSFELRAFSIAFKTWVDVPTPDSFEAWITGRMILIEQDGQPSLWFPAETHGICTGDFWVLNLHRDSSKFQRMTPWSDSPQLSLAPRFSPDEPLFVDAARQELFVFGMPVAQPANAPWPDNSYSATPQIWVYQIQHNRWIPPQSIFSQDPSPPLILKPLMSPPPIDTSAPIWSDEPWPLVDRTAYPTASAEETQMSVPPPRMLHQTVLDPNFGVMFQFGGTYTLTADEIVRRCAFVIRKQQFIESSEERSLTTARVDLVRLLRTSLTPLATATEISTSTGTKGSSVHEADVEALRELVRDYLYCSSPSDSSTTPDSASLSDSAAPNQAQLRLKLHRLPKDDGWC
ncbi:Muskelin N-terminus-domain-containing protein [Auriculariales sp. MPI-PUGE-AT-0066]|nr:Muskelin N-terminus-domain-containing protein [Auriculariales sp. MPI-PUGE-AT-0066]